MRLASAAISALVWSLFVFAHMALAAPQNEACSLPQDLQKEISTTYHEAQLVTISDLNESDRGLFEKDHGKSCPGLVRVDFYGDKKPTLALVFNTGDGANQKAELVVAHKVGPHWNTTLLETAKLSIPVVWSEKPGTYTDLYGNKTIRATKPVIVFCGYSAWAILYAWTGKDVDKVWLRD